MARETYVFDHATGELVPKRLRSRPVMAYSDLPMPMIMSDAIAPGISQVSGKYHDTRSGLMRDYKDYESRTGKRVNIVGDQVHHIIADNSRPETGDREAIRGCIKHALEKHAV